MRTDNIPHQPAVEYGCPGTNHRFHFTGTRPSFDLMKDISAVAWLRLQAAILKLCYPLEKLLLRHLGCQMLQKHPARKAGTRKAAKRKAAKRKAKSQASRRNAGAAKSGRTARATRPTTEQARPRTSGRTAANETLSTTAPRGTSDALRVPARRRISAGNLEET